MVLETEFTPWAGAAGGALIGLAAVLLMATSGKILGASGIWRGIMTSAWDEAAHWRVTFIAGMLVGALVLSFAAPQLTRIQFAAGLPLTIIGGFVVGLGVTLGGGCTSGHGICGIARFSTRSIVATMTFMAAAIVTVFLTRHVVT